MTNKLRSVIEENRKKTSALCLMFTDGRVDTMDIIRHVEHVQSILLDAITDEMKGSRLPNIDKTHSIHNQVLNDQIHKLKQAREELSTSLTQ